MQDKKIIFGDLRQSIFTRDTNKLKILLSNLSVVDFTDDQGTGILAEAASTGYVEMVDALLSVGFNINFADTDDLGYTPLIQAVRAGKTEMVKFLISKNADLEKGDSRNGTPLLHSCIVAQKEILKHLIDCGANVDATDNRGQTPLHYMCQYAKQWGSGTITEIVNGVEVNKENTRFAQHTEIVKMLITSKSDVNKQTAYGYSPLHWAAGSNTHEFINLLIDSGANIHLANANGYTPLHAAADSGALESCRLLLTAGASPNVIDNLGFTPLIGAVLGRHTSVAQLLLDHGADKNIKATGSYDKVVSGDTPLDVARKLGEVHLIKLLESTK